jgi:hypothetical protein
MLDQARPAARDPWRVIRGAWRSVRELLHSVRARSIASGGPWSTRHRVGVGGVARARRGRVGGRGAGPKNAALALKSGLKLDFRQSISVQRERGPPAEKRAPFD